jgi:hypothetical protein
MTVSVLKYYNTETEQWEIAAVGKQGPTGNTGPSGVITTTAPITNSGTNTAANIGIDQSQLASVSGNAVINGGFDIWQRGTTTASAGFLTDRFSFDTTGGQTATQSRQSFTPGELNATSSSGANFYYRLAISTASGFQQLRTRLEDARLFAGQTVTISYYAKAATAGGLISNVFLEQNFGSGGSAATQNTASVGGHPSLTTSWTRYSFTVDLPSISEKTVGSNSSLSIRIVVNGTGTLDLWGVQLEAGSVATPFRRNANSLQGELAACQRYYFRQTGTTASRFAIGSSNTTTSAELASQFPVTMRVAPTAIDTTGNVADYSIRESNSTFVASSIPVIAGGNQNTGNLNYSVASGLTVGRGAVGRFNTDNGFIGWSAEL